MPKATQEQRERCMKDFRLVRVVVASGVECDDCDRPAVCGTANDQTAAFHCAEHFHAFMARERAKRPPREELIARINAAIAAA